MSEPTPYQLAKKSLGFTLVELLAVVAIIGMLTTASIPVLARFGNNPSISQTGAAIATLLEQAQSRAMAHNTYVWVGFLPDSKDGVAGLTIATVESKTGQASDLSFPTNLQQAMKNLFIPNIALLTDPKIAGMAGGGVDISAPPGTGDTSGNGTLSSTPSFAVPTSTGSKQFKQILQFSPSGETILPSSSLFAWVNVGIKPLNGTQANIAAVQVSGMSGEVNLFLPE